MISGASREGIRDALAGGQRKLICRVRTIIEEGIAEGSMRSDVNIERATLAYVNWGWGKDLGSAIGIDEYLDNGHAAAILEIILDSMTNNRAEGR